MFWNLWLSNNRTTSVLQRWFSKADKKDCFDHDEIAWMKGASKSVRKLLEPLAMTTAKMWLTKTSYGDLAYLDKSEFQVWFLKGYQALDNDGHTTEALSSWIHARDLRFNTLPASEIEALAEGTGLEKTTHWYTGVGWIVGIEARGEKGARSRELMAKAIEMVIFFTLGIQNAGRWTDGCHTGLIRLGSI